MTTGRRAGTLSVIVPVLNEEASIPELVRRITKALDGGPRFDVIFVDDGSTDRTAQILQTLHAEDPRVKSIQLTRSFGHQASISAGLQAATGDAVVVMDGDLQDAPEILPRFIARWLDGDDVVHAIRETRQASWVKRTAYRAFYRLLARISAIDLLLDSGDFSLMDRRVVDVLNAMPERTAFRARHTALGGIPSERCAVRLSRPVRRHDQAHLRQARAPRLGRPLRFFLQATAAGVGVRRDRVGRGLPDRPRSRFLEAGPRVPRPRLDVPHRRGAVPRRGAADLPGHPWRVRRSHLRRGPCASTVRRRRRRRDTRLPLPRARPPTVDSAPSSLSGGARRNRRLFGVYLCSPYSPYMKEALGARRWPRGYAAREAAAAR